MMEHVTAICNQPCAESLTLSTVTKRFVNVYSTRRLPTSTLRLSKSTLRLPKSKLPVDPNQRYSIDSSQIQI